MKIRPVGAKFFYADGGWTDMMKQIVAFCNFANAPKKVLQNVVNSEESNATEIVFAA